MKKIFSFGGGLSLLIVALMVLPPAAAAADDNLERITVDQVRQLLDQGEEIIFLDSRQGYAWNASSVKLPDAIRVSDNAELAATIKTLPRDGKFVTYCT